MFNSAVCCTQSSFLLLLHKVEAFIGKKKYTFVYNKSQASFFSIAVFTPSTNILEQNIPPCSLHYWCLNCANTLSESSVNLLAHRSACETERRQRSRAGQGWWGTPLFQVVQPTEGNTDWALGGSHSLG